MRIRTLVSGTALAAGVAIAAGVASVQLPRHAEGIYRATPSAAPTAAASPYVPSLRALFPGGMPRGPDEVIILNYDIRDSGFMLRCANYVQGSGPSHVLGQLTARLVDPGGNFNDYGMHDPRLTSDGASAPPEFYVVLQLPRYGATPEAVQIMEGERILASHPVPPKRTCPGTPSANTPPHRR